MDILAETHMGYITTSSNNDILAQSQLGYLIGVVTGVTLSDIYDGVSAILTIRMPQATVEC